MCLDLEGSTVARSGGDRGRNYRCPTSGCGEYPKRVPHEFGTKLEKLRRSSPDIGWVRHEGLCPVTEESGSELRSGGRGLASDPRISRRWEQAERKSLLESYWAH